jgi:DNA-binding response OmpR family regulator
MGMEGVTSLAKVLIIEDDAELRKLYDRRFDVIGGFECTGAEIGMKGIDLVDDSYSLVVLDWNLPDTSGREVLNKLHQEYPNLPVIVVTGQTYPQDVAELPCAEYLVKPVSQTEWKAILEKLDLIE